MKRLKINWAIPGLFAMIAVIALVAWAQTQVAIDPDPAKLATQCASCHTMDTHVTAWQESSHKNVACTDCHADPGVAGWARMQYGRFLMWSRQDEADIAKIATEVPNERCIACHARQMPWVMQDLKPAKLDEAGEPIRPAKTDLKFLSAVAGHDVHLTADSPLKCTDCHSAVSHGPAPEKRPDHVATMHQICLDCHAQKQIPLEVRSSLSCSACHLDTGKLAPEDHKSAAFRGSHGQSALKDPANCQNCHLNPGLLKTASAAPHGLQTVAAGNVQPASTVPQIPAGTLKAPATGIKDDCATCHGITMPHPKTFVTEHVKGFNEKPELCATCHGNQTAGLNTKVVGDPKAIISTDATCTGCHQQAMPHPAGYVWNGHSQAAETTPKTCEQCHSSANVVNPNSPHAKASYCQDCHLTQFQHAAGYTATHQFDLARYGNNQRAAGCTTCHTATQNSCTACHTAGVGNQQQWHPASFVATHPATIQQKGGTQSCTECHTQTINACTACHTNGLTNGQPTQWHPANWWVVHAQTTKATDRDSCNKCHSYVEPSCTKCHSSF